MDRVIAEKGGISKVQMIVASVVVVLIIAGFYFGTVNSKETVKIDAERTRITQVKRGEFDEYIPITGQVQPKTTVFLDLEEGGIVEKVYLEAGQAVKAGDLLLRFSNTAVQKQNIDSETRLLENLDRLRTSKVSLTEKNLLLQEQLLDLNFELERLSKTYDRYQVLNVSESNPLSIEEYEQTEDRIKYLEDKRDLLIKRIEQENELRGQQNEQIDKSIKLVNRSLVTLERIMESLDVKAPIDGYLSFMDAEVGQSFTRGERVGRIDQLDGLKVRADIDQFYISKVQIGQEAKFEVDGKEYTLAISKIFPEVEDEVFQVDMNFVDGDIDGIKRGQTLQIDLTLSESRMTTIASKGGFYRYTNGQWVYRVNPDGTSAERINIISGRQNPKHFEVLEGLEVGDWIIVSNYDLYNNAEILSFSKPISLKN